VVKCQENLLTGDEIMVNELTIEILSERMGRIEESLKNAQKNNLIPSNMAIKAQIMQLTIDDWHNTDMSEADSKALAKYWRNVSPTARELNLDVPAQGQPKKDYGSEMSTWDSLMALIIGVLTNAIETNEDTRLADAMRSMPRSPSKNDVYGTVEACLQHNIADKAQNRVRSHHDNKTLSWGEDGMPSFNVEETQG
jgi:hypothetical protein